MAAIQPERLLVRKTLPLFPAALIVSFLVAAPIGGPGVGVSAIIAVALVFLDVLATAAGLAWSAGVSAGATYAVVLGGFALKLVVLAAALLALRGLSWFSTLAFIAAFVPCMLLVLVYEMKLLSGPIQAELWYFRDGPR